MKKIIFVLDEVDSNYDLFTIFKKYNISKSFSLNYHAHRIFEKMDYLMNWVISS